MGSKNFHTFISPTITRSPDPGDLPSGFDMISSLSSSNLLLFLLLLPFSLLFFPSTSPFLLLPLPRPTPLPSLPPSPPPPLIPLPSLSSPPSLLIPLFPSLSHGIVLETGISSCLPEFHALFFFFFGRKNVNQKS